MTNTFSRRLLQILALAVAGAFVAMASYAAVEPAVSSAQSASDDVTVSLTVDEEIAITDGANATMSPNIGITSDTSTGSSTWSVETNANTGYTLAVKASTSPAMQHQSTSDSFADYTESTSGTPDSWSVDSNSYEFGFSAYGTDVDGSVYGSGSSCDGSGNPANTSLNYEGFETSDNNIASRSTTTPTSGVDTTICFGAGQNGSFAPSGSYQATVVATATTN